MGLKQNFVLGLHQESNSRVVNKSNSNENRNSCCPQWNLSGSNLQRNLCCIHWYFPVNLFPLAQRALSPMELESTHYIHYALIFKHMFENRKKRHTDRIVRVSQWESNTKLCTNCQINNMTICTFCSAKSPQSSQCRFTYDLQLFYLRFHVVFHLYEIFRGKLYYEA